MIRPFKSQAPLGHRVGLGVPVKAGSCTASGWTRAREVLEARVGTTAAAPRFPARPAVFRRCALFRDRRIVAIPSRITAVPRWRSVLSGPPPDQPHPWGEQAPAPHSTPAGLADARGQLFTKEQVARGSRRRGVTPRSRDGLGLKSGPVPSTSGTFAPKVGSPAPAGGQLAAFERPPPTSAVTANARLSGPAAVSRRTRRRFGEFDGGGVAWLMSCEMLPPHVGQLGKRIGRARRLLTRLGRGMLAAWLLVVVAILAPSHRHGHGAEACGASDCGGHHQSALATGVSGHHASDCVICQLTRALGFEGPAINADLAVDRPVGRCWIPIKRPSSESAPLSHWSRAPPLHA